MRGRFLVGLALTVLFFSVAADVDAQELNRVVFNGWTQVQPQGTPPVAVNKIAFIIYTTFNPVAHPPDFVQQITVSAPDGSVFSLDPDKDWIINDQAFYKNFLATDFISKAIPGGRYRATVVSTSGSSIAETDEIAATFLSLPSITYPTAGLTNVPAQPTFRWTAVSGATYYRVILWNYDSGEPVFNYYMPWANFQTDRTVAKIPKGILKPNTRYNLQVQARGDSNETDVRSQTSFVRFTTGSW